MKKLVVSEETCISCGACMQIDEEHFDFSSNGTSKAISQENLDTEALHQAIDACPVAAIRLEETDEEVNTNDEKATINNETENDEGCGCENKTCENCNCHNNEEM